MSLSHLELPLLPYSFFKLIDNNTILINIFLSLIFGWNWTRLRRFFCFCPRRCSWLVSSLFFPMLNLKQGCWFRPWTVDKSLRRHNLTSLIGPRSLRFLASHEHHLRILQINCLVLHKSSLLNQTWITSCYYGRSTFLISASSLWMFCARLLWQ